MKTINKTITVNASKEKVWETIVSGEKNKIWLSEFSPGSYCITDWKEGSEARFLDQSAVMGMIGRVKVSRPYEKIVLGYHGIIVDNQDVFEGKEVEQWKSVEESYTLTEKNGQTDFTVLCNMPDVYFDHLNKLWDKALTKIKELTEGA
jgi:hypothetical protein